MTPTSMDKQTQVNIEARSPAEITQVLLQDGWHSVKNPELVQFAIGEAHSPVQPSKLYPSLRYTDTQSGQTTVTPLSRINGFQFSGKTSY